MSTSSFARPPDEGPVTPLVVMQTVIAGVDTTTHQFRINALTVDYDASSATTTLANRSIVEVQGTALTSTTNAKTHFEGPGGMATGAATFFAQAANHVVKVRGSFSGGMLIAAQAQIEQ
jgi:hypothetical protein